MQITVLNNNDECRRRLLRIPRSVYGVAILIGLCTALAYASSYWRSVQFNSATSPSPMMKALSVSLPLVRLAAKASPQSGFLTYDRGPVFWNYDGVAGKTPLRSWMSRLNTVGCTGGMFLDFGFWTGDWQSNSRPGPFVVLFVPIWFVGLVVSDFIWRFTFG